MREEHERGGRGGQAGQAELPGRMALAPCPCTRESEMPLKDNFISDFSPVSGSVFVVLLPGKH